MRYGQVVCVRNWSSPTMWRIRIFVAAQVFKGQTIFLCKIAGEEDDAAAAWTECVPLNHVEPRAFLEDE